ncbi:MAG: O-methyltransferase [Dehalococcoidia bacterium]
MKYLDGSRKDISITGPILSYKELFWFFLTNPGWLRYLIEWRKTIGLKKKNPLANAIDYELPWLTFGAIYWVKRHTKSDMKVFEYSSGGSTLFFAQRVAEVISVEHDRDWYSKLSGIISDRRLINSRLFLVEPEIKREGQQKYISQTFPQYAEASFEKYVKFIGNYPDNYFDLVLVDGRSRPFCLTEAVRKIRPGGYLILDNSDRSHYQEAMNSLNAYKREDFIGFVPFDEHFARTTIWQIR